MAQEKAKEKMYGSVRRFGPRYGRKIKYKISQIEAIYKGTHKCPYCNYTAVKRLAVGIWYCSKCNTKFTGKAYSPLREKLVAREAVTEEVEEEHTEKETEEEETA